MKVFTIYTVFILLSLFPLLSGGKTDEPQENEDSMMMMMEDSGNGETEMGPFINYKDPEQAMMLAGEKPTVLFFNASWCPTCREAREDFTAHSESLKNINLVLVDYDNSDALKKKYAVTYQHTFVQIDQDGMALAVWNGGGAEELLENIEKEEM